MKEMKVVYRISPSPLPSPREERGEGGIDVDTFFLEKRGENADVSLSPSLRGEGKGEGQIASAILQEAEEWIGTPYRHGGSTKGVGCDCLGLVRGIWRALYGEEPEDPGTYAPDWAEAGHGDPLLEAARRHMAEKPVDAMQPGDLLVFRWRPSVAAKHLGILAPDNRFIHAYEGHRVTASALVPQWRGRIAGVFGFADAERFISPPSALPGISPTRGEIG